MNIKDIFESWMKTTSPSKEELQIALERMEICKVCPNNVEGLGGVRVCSLCFCPLIYNDKPIGKLFSKEECPNWKKPLINHDNN